MRNFVLHFATLSTPAIDVGNPTVYWRNSRTADSSPKYCIDGHTFTWTLVIHASLEACVIQTKHGHCSNVTPPSVWRSCTRNHCHSSKLWRHITNTSPPSIGLSSTVVAGFTQYHVLPAAVITPTVLLASTLFHLWGKQAGRAGAWQGSLTRQELPPGLEGGRVWCRSWILTTFTCHSITSYIQNWSRS